MTTHDAAPGTRRTVPAPWDEYVDLLRSAGRPQCADGRARERPVAGGTLPPAGDERFARLLHVLPGGRGASGLEPVPQLGVPAAAQPGRRLRQCVRRPGWHLPHRGRARHRQDPVHVDRPRRDGNGRAAGPELPIRRLRRRPRATSGRLGRRTALTRAAGGSRGQLGRTAPGSELHPAADAVLRLGQRT